MQMIQATGLRTAPDSQLRLAVIDSTAVDKRRRLVLIRRDDIEHLLMTGGPEDIVIEQNNVHPASPSPDETHMPRRPRLHDIVRAADTPVASEPEFRPSRAKPPANSDAPLRLARARKPVAKMEPSQPTPPPRTKSAVVTSTLSNLERDLASLLGHPTE